MSGYYDNLMLNGDGQQAPAKGRFLGTAVPSVGGISYHGYTQPPNWQNPSVTGHNLMVHRDTLRSVASGMRGLAGELQGAISSWQGAASGAAGAAGSWPEAQAFAKVIGRAADGFGQYSNDLRQSHDDTATRLAISADKYDTAEHTITSMVSRAGDPSATIVESGGNNRPVDPGYGKNWTPQQRQAYAKTQQLISMNGGGESWNGTFPIAESGAPGGGGTSGYTWQQVEAMLNATNPDAITAAGRAYGQLADKMTTVAGHAARFGQTLAQSWGGSTAVTAVSQVQQLHQTATDMQANAWQAQQALTWYGSVLSTFKSDLPKPASTHPADVHAANQAAQQRMAALNGHIQTAFNAMPGAVNKNLPPKLASTGGGQPSAGAGGGGGAGGGIPGGAPGSGTGAAGGSPGVPGTPGTPPMPSAPHLGSPPGSTPPPGSSPPGSSPPVGVPPATHLAGAPPPPNGTPPPNIGTPPGPSGPGPVTSGPAPTGPSPMPVSPGPRLGTPPEQESPPPEGLPPSGESGGLPPGEEPLPGEGFGEGPVPGSLTSPGGNFAGGPRPFGEDPVPGEAGFPGGPGAAAGEPAAAEGGTFPMTGSSGGAGAGAADRARQSWITEEEGTWDPGFPGGSGIAGESAAADGGMFPMTGSAGPGAESADRMRQSWMNEEDAWGSDGLPAGGDPGDGLFMPVGPGGSRDEERERVRQAWLAEDEDLWGARDYATPPVIGV